MITWSPSWRPTHKYYVKVVSLRAQSHQPPIRQNTEPVGGGKAMSPFLLFFSISPVKSSFLLLDCPKPLLGFDLLKLVFRYGFNQMNHLC
jgi:hypothetical protein